MAYKSLYRAYRPQVFEDVSGQEAIIKTLRHAVSENRIAHAYLFCGPRGTGKTTVAKLFAKAVNCTSDHKPCGECESCKAIENGSHQDVIEIDAASNNGVEEVRNLIDKVKYAPVSGKYKVYIIDEVHMMSSGAFNALLKTLEEPPAHVIFILATTEPHKILPTIISRCQRFDFKSLTDTQMINRMKEVLNEEKQDYEESALSLIAKLANGGMRDALSILEQCLAYNEEKLTEKNISLIYGIVSLEDKINLIKQLLAGNMQAVLDMLEKMGQVATDIKRLTFDLIDILKDIVIYKNTNNTQILTILTKEYIDTIVPYMTSDEALHFIDALVEATEKYSRAVNPELYFELTLLKLSNRDSKEVGEIIKPKVKEPIPTKPDIEIQMESTQDEEVEEIPEIVEENTNVETSDEDIQVALDDYLNILIQAKRTYLTSLQEKWPIIEQYMTNLKQAKVANLLTAGKPVAACKDAVVIACDFKPDVNAINYYKNYRPIENLLEEVVGEKIKFVGIQSNDWLQLRNKFIELKKSNQLPTPRPIEFKHLEGKDLDDLSSLNEAQKYAIETFGKDIVELMED